MYINSGDISDSNLLEPFSRGLTGLQQPRVEPAAKGFDELNGGNQTQAGKLGCRPLSGQPVAIGVHDLDVTYDAGIVTF